MKTYSRSHLTDPALLHSAAEHFAQVRDTDAEFLADIAEIDARKAFVPAGYPSMRAWCIGELRLSVDSASKRIQAARAAGRFPAIFPALAEGRLHLSAVCLVAPHLTEGTAQDLLAAVMGKTSDEIRQLIADRFPRSELLAMVEPLPHGQHAPEHVATLTERARESQHAPEHVETQSSKVSPIARERFAIHLTIGQSTHDKLQYARELLSHQIPTGDMAEVLDRALEALIRHLEKTKFAATERPRRVPRCVPNGGRYVPAEVKRAVWKRDSGQCTFVGETGHRCAARTLLEFDHVDPVARRPGDCGTNAAALSCTQSIRGGAPVWRRLHGSEARGGKRTSSEGGTWPKG